MVPRSAWHRRVLPALAWLLLASSAAAQQKPLTILLLEITGIALFYVALVSAIVIEREAAEIGLQLTESFQWVPEQSTAAIYAHHPDAKYYSVGSLDRSEQILGVAQG